MEKEYDSDDDNSRSCTRQGILLRVLLVVFAVLALVLVIIAVALLLTQKPVDLSLSPIPAQSDENITESEQLRQQLHRIKPAAYNRFTFDQLFSGKLFLKDSYDSNWLPDGSLLRKKDEFLGTTPEVLRTPMGSFESAVFLNDSEYARSLSSDLKYAYRTHKGRQVFRHSVERVYEIVRIVNGVADGGSWNVGPVENSTIQAFYWNPDQKNHDFVFVHNFNVYYQSDPEKPDSAVQLTTDGEYYNRYGVSNWLYEEEILDDIDPLWWSKSGRYVSYLKFDDKNVNRVFLPTYTENDPYVEYFEVPYPKAGVAQNTLITQYIWDRHTNKIVEATAPDELKSTNESYYIYSNTWIEMPKDLVDLGKERLITVWTNRQQRTIYYTLCNETDCIMTFSQSFNINGREMWAEPREVGTIIPTKTGFFTILPHQHKEDNNVYNHIAHIEFDSSGTGKINKWIGENYDVMKILGYYMERDILTFEGYGTEIGEKNIYRVAKASNPKLEDSISKMNALVENCVHGMYSVDPTGQRATLSCHEPFENTRLYLMNVDKPRQFALLEGEDKAHLPFDKMKLEYGKVKLPSGIEGNYAIMTPPVLEEGRKLPMVMDLYGGPNTRKVQKTTPSAHFIQISSQYEIVVVHIDVSGTAGRGWNVKEPVFMNIGSAETKDTLDILQYLLKKYPFIDEDNVAVMGWSYGGYLTSQIALRDQGETVKCAISIAPVTDFKYYDTAYTERYLGLPFDNPFGYERTNLIPHARNMTNVKYFLAHGEKDDNVHYQNSARWAEALQIENIHFTQLVYANEAHGLSGKITHLYSEVQRFLTEECFKPNPISY